ncbi:hypothetical protein ANCCAN_08853 [Ancylostoma caninum]|uniref:Uncharacterized protein n=1 Tax=Ancylostoma caninum TaxID=29170 RepID=A0A368GLB6_ANCCA|nr:hypothetical protein ANCCAN_08853 [Ancylostoma caninum]
MGAKQSAANRRLQLKNEKSPFKSGLTPKETTPVKKKPSQEDIMEQIVVPFDIVPTRQSDQKPEKTQRSSSFRRRGRKVLKPIGSSSMSLKLAAPVICPCPTFGELRHPPEAHPRRVRHVEQVQSTRAEKPRKREKFKRKSKQIDERPKQEKTQASKETTVASKETAVASKENAVASKETAMKEKKAASPQKKEKDTSCYLQVLPGTEKTTKHKDSASYPVLETACEEHAFITEAVNKPPPKIDNFFELANPFENECDMLDVSDTIFDIANDFPNICLNSKELMPDIEAFNIERPVRNLHN